MVDKIMEKIKDLTPIEKFILRSGSDREFTFDEKRMLFLNYCDVFGIGDDTSNLILNIKKESQRSCFSICYLKQIISMFEQNDIDFVRLYLKENSMLIFESPKNEINILLAERKEEEEEEEEL